MKAKHTIKTRLLAPKVSRLYLHQQFCPCKRTEGREPWTERPNLPFLPLALKSWVCQVIEPFHSSPSSSVPGCLKAPPPPSFSPSKEILFPLVQGSFSFSAPNCLAPGGCKECLECPPHWPALSTPCRAFPRRLFH